MTSSRVELSRQTLWAQATAAEQRASDERRCYVHVGTHKTGTTSIQTFLRDNRAVFAEHGVLIPRSGRSENDAGHHNLALQLLGLPDFVPENGGLLELTHELEMSDLPTACISSEHFSHLSRFPDALGVLKGAIVHAGFEPIIVAYLRPQPAYFTSIYAEIVKNGHRKPFDEYTHEVLDYGTFLADGIPGPTFRYDALLDRFGAVFGHAAITPQRYHGGARDGALLESIATLLVHGPIKMADFTLPTVRENPTLTFAGVLKLFDPAIGQRSIAELGADDLRFTPLGVGRTLLLMRTFLRSNVELYRKYRLALPPCELRDLFWALPIRKTARRTRVLNNARRALLNLGLTETLQARAN